MIKKLLGLIVSILFVLSSFAIEVEGLYYNITGTNTVEVTCRGADIDGEDGWMYYSSEELYVGNVSIPETIEYQGTTYNVTAIGNDAFAGSRYMSQLCIPASVLSIGNEAFTSCNNLQSIAVAEDNEIFFSDFGILYSKNPIALYFVPRAIQGDIVLNDAITEIPSSAFQYCTGITTVQLPDNVVSIGDGAFNACSALSDVFLNNKLKTIGVQAFSKCSEMENITIPESVQSIGKHAFTDCSNLSFVFLKEGLQTIDPYAFYNCKNIGAISLPSTLKSIGNKAFEGCTSLDIIQNKSSLTLVKGSEDNGCVAKYASSVGNGETEIIFDFTVKEPESKCFHSIEDSTYQVYVFTMNSSENVDSLQWDFGNGKKSQVLVSNQYIQSYDAPGTYSVTLTVWKDNKEYSITKENLITIYQAPKAEFEIYWPDKDGSEVVPYYVEIGFSQINNVSYLWTLYNPEGEKDFVTEELPYPLTINKSGLYSLSLEVSDENACHNMVEKQFFGKNVDKGFEYISPGSCHDAVGDDVNSVSYKIENNNLILYGIVIRTCEGTTETAQIIDLGDTIQIPTYSTVNGPLSDCICPFDFEITIQNFDRERCVIVFDGQMIYVDRNVDANVVESNTISMWYSSLTNQVFVDFETQLNFEIELYSSQGKLIEKQHVIGASVQVDLPQHNDVYFVRIMENGKVVKSGKFIR